MNENETHDNVQLLKEMVESMTSSIDNLRKVRFEQNVLIKVIESTDKAAMFETFISGMKESMINEETQAKTLEKRRDILQSICDRADKDEYVAKLVNDLTIALGVF